MHGNDFQSWRDATDDALVQAVARGIRSADPNHIHTAELNFLTSGSLDDPSWAPLIELDAAYTYFPTYAQVLNEYKQPDAKPSSWSKQITSSSTILSPTAVPRRTSDDRSIGRC